MWDKFKQDFKERFLNFETAKGIYMVPAGLIVVYVTIYQLQYLLQAVGCLFGWYIVSEGLRKILVNRIKQEFIKSQLIDQRLAIVKSDPATAAVDISAPATTANVTDVLAPGAIDASVAASETGTTLNQTKQS